MIKNFLLVGLGGMLGSMCRYAASFVVKNPSYPYATFCVNLVGSFVIGAVAGYALRNTDFSIEWRLFLATGLCGGFTTFSAFSLECIQLLQQSRFAAATAYIALSIVLGIAFAFAGWMLMKQIIA